MCFNIPVALVFTQNLLIFLCVLRGAVLNPETAIEATNWQACAQKKLSLQHLCKTYAIRRNFVFIYKAD